MKHISDTSLRAYLERALSDLRVELDSTSLDRLDAHWQLLLTWHSRFHLTTVTDPRHAAALHYMDSLAPLAFQELSSPLLDIGSGAGFPGLILAIARPTLSVTALEKNRRRSSFLRLAAARLGLANFRVLNRPFSASSPPPGPFLTVTSRATIPLPVILPQIATLPYALELLLYAVSPDDCPPLPPTFEFVAAHSFNLPLLGHPRTLITLSHTPTTRKPTPLGFAGAP